MDRETRLRSWSHSLRMEGKGWNEDGQNRVEEGCGVIWSHDRPGGAWRREGHGEERGAEWWWGWRMDVQGVRQGWRFRQCRKQCDRDNKSGGMVEEETCMGTVDKSTKGKMRR